MIDTDLGQFAFRMKPFPSTLVQLSVRSFLSFSALSRALGNLCFLSFCTSPMSQNALYLFAPHGSWIPYVSNGFRDWFLFSSFSPENPGGVSYGDFPPPHRSAQTVFFRLSGLLLLRCGNVFPQGSTCVVPPVLPRAVFFFVLYPLLHF